MTEGQQQVFVATNALGLGIDRSTICVVIHDQPPKKMRDYAQETGRAGRGGQLSEAIVVIGAAYRADGMRQPSGWVRDTEERMRALVAENGCRRVVLDREMDGNKTRKHCEEREAQCDWCCKHRRGDVVETGASLGEDDVDRAEFNQQRQARAGLRRREMEVQSKEQIEVQEMIQALEVWSEGCPWCRAWGEETWRRHRLADCTEADAGEVRAGVEKMKALARWEMYSCCFDCGVPQAICDSFESSVDGGWRKKAHAECQYQGILLASITALWARWGELFSAWISARMEQEGTSLFKDAEFKKAVAWMTQKIRWGGIESNRMCWVLWAFQAEIREEEGVEKIAIESGL